MHDIQSNPGIWPPNHFQKVFSFLQIVAYPPGNKLQIDGQSILSANSAQVVKPLHCQVLICGPDAGLHPSQLVFSRKFKIVSQIIRFWRHSHAVRMNISRIVNDTISNAVQKQACLIQGGLHPTPQARFRKQLMKRPFPSPGQDHGTASVISGPVGHIDALPQMRGHKHTFP